MKLNGNLVLNTAGQSEIQNLVIERVTGSLPTFSSAEKGRIVFFNGDSKFYINDGSVWVSLATGGNATALQNETDAVEASLGGFINTDGTFNASPLNALSSVNGATSLMNALEQMDAAMTGKDALAELVDTNIVGTAVHHVLAWDNTAGKWVNRLLDLSDISDVTATPTEINELSGGTATQADFIKLHLVTSSAAELNKLTGVTTTTAQLNYINTTTSDVQTQLNNKQPLDAQLTAVAALTPVANDVLVGMADGTYQLLQGAGLRSAEGLVIGTDIQAWDLQLDKISALSTGDNNFIVGNGTDFVVESGATARTSLGLGDIAVLDAAEFIRTDGTSTVTGDIKLDGWKLTNVGAPTNATDATNKAYVDSAIAGLTWKAAVDAATDGPVTLSGTQTVDGIALVVGNRVLVKNQAASGDNGIYVVAAGAWTRPTDADTAAELTDGTAVFVRGGTINGDSGFVQTSIVATLGTSAQTWTSFSGATSFVDGIGLKRTGNQVDVNLGAGIKELPSDEVGIDIFNPTSSALILTNDGTSRGTDTGFQLHLKTNLTQFDQDTTGLFMKAGGITAAELNGSVAGNGLVGGAGTPLAVTSHAGTASTVGTITVTADAVGVDLGTTATTAAPGNHVHSAAVVTYSNATSGLLATNTQAAIDEVEGRTDTLETNAANLLTEVNLVEAGVGLNTDGTYTAPSGTNYIGGAATVKAATVALDGKIKAAETALSSRITNNYHLYSGSAATSHTVTHGIGSQFCVVTVIDAGTNEQIIPNSVTFDSTTELTVTLNTSLAIKVVVVGLGTYTAV